MKRLYLIVVFIFLFFAFSPATVKACEIVTVSLRKEFRQAKDVFLGEINSVQKDKFYQITFNVLKSWKGRKQKQLRVEAFDSCLCPNRQFDFTVGKRFLVMTTLAGEDKKLIFEPCPLYVYQLDKSEKAAQETIKRLDKFWFRTWARVYPF